MTNKILNNIKEKLNNESITLETKVTEVGIDSLDLMTNIFELEEEYSVELDQDQLLEIESFGDLVNAIESKI